MISSAFRLARVLVLLGLLYMTGWYQENRYRRMQEFELSDEWRAWLVAVLIIMAFAVVLILDRRRRESWPALVVEAVVAAPVAFVPPLQWVAWLGTGHWSGPLLFGSIAPTLAAVWLVVVVTVGFRQLRAARRTGPRPSTADEISPA